MKSEEIKLQINELKEQLEEVKLQERINEYKLNYIELNDLIESGKCELRTANIDYENDNYISFKIELKKIKQLEDKTI